MVGKAIQVGLMVRPDGRICQHQPLDNKQHLDYAFACGLCKEA